MQKTRHESIVVIQEDLVLDEMDTILHVNEYKYLGVKVISWGEQVTEITRKLTQKSGQHQP